ncbi:P2Y purinoceptor 3-like [Denticeps clupeoides]|uniref:P2Y purinoceptor 3-like n=1 Tax=Denticeps clupeoides TaxID=299321 RepID=UPI0010A33723|nr:P2Y purinoceptor 3-like [Denticeps clupeoides]
MPIFSPKIFSMIDGNSSLTLSADALNFSFFKNSSDLYSLFGGCTLNRGQAYFRQSMEILTALLGFPANLRVLWILLWAQVVRSTSDLYTGSLAVTDAMYCVSLPIEIIMRYIENSSDAATSFIYFSFRLNELGVPPLLACICLDRYVAVLHPTAFMRLRDNKLRILSIVVIWSCALSYAIDAITDKSQYKIGNSITFTVCIGCFLLIIFCNLSLLKALMDSGPVARDSMHPVKKRAFITVLIIFIVITVSFLPALISYVFNMFFMNIRNALLYFCLYSTCTAFSIPRTAFQPLFFLYHARKLPFMSPTNPNSVSCC